MSQNVSKCPRFENHANQLRSAINMIMRLLCPIRENRIGRCRERANSSADCVSHEKGPSFQVLMGSLGIRRRPALTV
jgi:hypothetical protein